MYSIDIFILCILPILSHQVVADRLGGSRQEFTFECKSGESLSRIVSEHKDNVEDRFFDFSCSKLPVKAFLDACEWSDFTYRGHGVLHFQCPESGLITGIHSKYDNSREDRMFSFKCCSPTSYVLHSCEKTMWSNSYDKKKDAKVPNGYVMRGWTSVYSKKHYDRIYALLNCRLGKIYS
ncbi:hemagglutinin/amebocyte aggregation factor [Plakobranchus ocellatus]|uniref:Hemagglutinin/amebocyte aggregation factor n=1 Tax=Plakobranchus ocellatus TaxID=259542 RepID=A0AAV3YVX2_9GAST|nr:hemagglutinin/amebocyte aggregation factor [Plakobranchus ocellatus]